MSPPQNINFSIIKDGVNVSNNAQVKMNIYYIENAEKLKVDFKSEFNSSYAFFNTYLPSLDINKKRNYFLTINENAKEYKITVDLNKLSSNCENYTQKEVYLDDKIVISKNINDMKIYELNL